MFSKVTLIVSVCLTCISNAWVPDSSKLFWNKDFTIEFGYTFSLVSMYKLNKYYIDDFAKPFGILDKNFHFCTFWSPEVGLVFTNNIISFAYQRSDMILKGIPQKDFFGGYSTPNLYVSFWGFSGTFRRVKELKKILLSFGGTVLIGKSYADVADNFFHELAKSENRLNEGLGGGGSLFTEFNYVFLKYFLLSTRLSANVILTETLKNKDSGKWVVDENNHEINLDYSGISLGFRFGLIL